MQKYLVDSWKCRPGVRKDIGDVDVKCLGVIKDEYGSGRKVQAIWKDTDKNGLGEGEEISEPYEKGELG